MATKTSSALRALAAGEAAPARFATLTTPAMSIFFIVIISCSRQHFAEAFQPPSTFKLQPTTTTSTSTKTTRSPFTRHCHYPCANGGVTTMLYQSPSDLAANSVSHKDQPDVGQAGGGAVVGTSPGPTIFSVPGLLSQDCPLRVGDPDVRETNTGYTLIFKLPPDVKGDGLDVSVSGRLLTVEARVTREGRYCSGDAEGGAPGAGGGWETAFTRTHSAARSFVIPVGVSNEVTASWVSDGRVEIKLNKLPSHSTAAADTDVGTTAAAGAGAGAAGVAAAVGGAVATSPTATMEDWGGVAVKGIDKSSGSSSAAEGYLSSLTGSSPAGGTVGAKASSSTDPSAEPLTPSTTAAAWPSRRRRDRSMVAALDDEFRDLAKSMWEDAVRFPTEEQVAATVAKARHERAKRVRVMRRAMMATDVSESELSYVVR